MTLHAIVFRFCHVNRMSSKSKSLTNDTACVVEDCLRGFVALNPGIQLLKGHRVVIRTDIENLKHVALLSGGGSGHEPAHAGYVGEGMLTGAIAGSVFASPPTGSILAAIHKVGKCTDAGVLLIIKNYTGDRLNFGIAAERAKVLGIAVEMVVVGEDCALTSADKTAGRRGLCGTVFIHKIAGALAAEGATLRSIADYCRSLTSQMGTIGLSLSPCVVPGAGPSFTLAADEMELGLGIHGEAGVRRMKILSAKEAVGVMLEHMTLENSATRLDINKGDHVAVMINNLGGTSVLEMNIVAKEVIDWCESRGVHVDRAYCGSFMTSLQMAGVSVTVLHVDERVKQLLDAPTSAVGWQPAYLCKTSSDRQTLPLMSCDLDTSDVMASDCAEISDKWSQMLEKAVTSACEALIAHETELNEFDTQAGDGDCGSTFKLGAKAVLARAKSLTALPVSRPHDLLMTLAHIAERDMGGSSGALYSLFWVAAAEALFRDTSMKAWACALREGNAAIAKYGGAEPGDRTMLDALHAAELELSAQLRDGNAQPLAAFTQAVSSAERAAQATAGMKARAGRASYVSSEHVTKPDPGAYAVAVWMRAALESCRDSAI